MNIEYQKFSDERRKKYCISTTIIRENDTKHVVKEAIFTEGMEHLNNMLRYSKELEKTYPNVKICPVEKKEDRLYFEFVDGKLLSDVYDEAVKKNDKAKFIELLKMHKNLVLGKEDNSIKFTESEQSRFWLGDLSSYEGKPALACSNFDAIAGNIIIQNNIPVFIDYEWVFEFPVPTDIVVYHCIFDAYLHNASFEKLIPISEAMDILGVICDMDKMENAYKNFFKNVIEDDDGNSFALMKNLCLKKISYVDKNERKNIKELQNEIIVLKQQISELKEEQDRVVYYWKQSNEVNRLYERQSRIFNDIINKYGSVENIDKIIYDKDIHILNCENIIKDLKQNRMLYKRLIRKIRKRK